MARQALTVLAIQMCTLMYQALATPHDSAIDILLHLQSQPKCLALGATAVLVGRPILWGLTLGGEEGAKAVLSTLRAELEHDMALLGVPSLAQLNEDYIIPPSGGVLALPAARL